MSLNKIVFDALLKLVKSYPDVKLLDYAVEGPIGPWIATEKPLHSELVCRIKKLAPEFWERTVPVTD